MNRLNAIYREASRRSNERRTTSTHKLSVHGPLKHHTSTAHLPPGAYDNEKIVEIFHVEVNDTSGVPKKKHVVEVQDMRDIRCIRLVAWYIKAPPNTVLGADQETIRFEVENANGMPVTKSTVWPSNELILHFPAHPTNPTDVYYQNFGTPMLMCYSRDGDLHFNRMILKIVDRNGNAVNFQRMEFWFEVETMSY